MKYIRNTKIIHHIYSYISKILCCVFIYVTFMLYVQIRAKVNLHVLELCKNNNNNMEITRSLSFSLSYLPLISDVAFV